MEVELGDGVDTGTGCVEEQEAVLHSAMMTPVGVGFKPVSGRMIADGQTYGNCQGNNFSATESTACGMRDIAIKNKPIQNETCST